MVLDVVQIGLLVGEGWEVDGGGEVAHRCSFCGEIATLRMIESFRNEVSELAVSVWGVGRGGRDERERERE